MIIIPATIYILLLLIFNAISITLFNTNYYLFKNLFLIYILNGIMGILLVDIHKGKIKKIIDNKSFNIIEYLPYKINVTRAIILSIIYHLLLIFIPIILIYYYPIDINELFSFNQIIKSLFLLLLITLLYKLYIYPNTIKNLYLL